MNKGYALFLVAGLCACNTPFKPTFTPAAKGTAVGSPVTATMDSAGGKIVSADGRLEVTFPAGVLTASTQISIQNITNTAPNGLGSAYRLSPEGTTFSQPVTLTFHLTDMQSVGLASTFVATQHADNLWYSQVGQTRDSAAKTVSVNATHFSDWGIAETVLLKPLQTRVKTSSGATFTAEVLALSQDGDLLSDPSGGDELALPAPATLDKQLNSGTKVWAVNAVTGGNTTLGLVKDPGSFIAPDKEPSPSAVAVTLTIVLGKSKIIAPAEADIYANEIWTGATDVNQADGSKIHADVTFTQKMESGSETHLNFTVQQGTVHYTPAAMTGAGCPQTVSPDSQQIGPNDGTLSLTYDLSNGLDDATVTGGGTTTWQGTYNIQCPNAPTMIDSTVMAQWWPLNYANPTGGLTAESGVLDGTITTPTATATIHFVRQ